MVDKVLNAHGSSPLTYAKVDRFVKESSEPFSVVYKSFPTAKDPSWPEYYQEKSTIDSITIMPYGMVEKWQYNRWKRL